MLKEISRDDFASQIDTEFPIAGSTTSMPVLVLSQVSEARLTSNYESFSLVFTGPADRFLPQQIYPLQHEKLGQLSLFLVPVGRDDAGYHYEAVFNRLSPTEK